MNAKGGSGSRCRLEVGIVLLVWLMSKAMPHRPRTFWPSGRLAEVRFASRGWAPIPFRATYVLPKH